MLAAVASAAGTTPAVAAVVVGAAAGAAATHSIPNLWTHHYEKAALPSSPHDAAHVFT